MENYISTLLSHALDAAPRPDGAAPARAAISLADHDRRFHPHGFDPSKDRCKLREELAKGDEADVLEVEAAEAAETAEAAGTGTPSTPQDYAEVMAIRDRLEPIARLLNGRAGNWAALTSSSRWHALRDYAQKPLNAMGSGLFISQAQTDINFLDRNILNNPAADPALVKPANALRDAAEAIIVSSASKWDYPAKMVPSKSEIPTAPATPLPTSLAPTSPAPTAPAPAAPSAPAIDPDDARALILRAAKSINRHIDKGDFTPNAKAIADVQAAKADIAALNDPDLTRALAEIDASAQNGYQTRIGKVPLPSAANAPSGGAGGFPAGLLGALAAALGVPAPQKAKPVPGTTTAGAPFSDGPSPYEAFLNAANAGHPAATDPNAFKTAADALTETDARDILEGPGGFLVPGGYRDSIHPNDPDEKVLWSGWKPSQRLSPDTIRCAAVCFSDLRRRFPDMPWKNNLELRCGTKAFTGGQSTHTADDRRHTVLFNCDYGNIWPGTGLGHGADNYGHPDARFPFDVLRHEMGHALMSGSLPGGRRMISKWHDAMTKAYGNPATELEKFARKYVSKYAVTNKGNGFSMAECLSECFSLATSPDYQPGYLPRPVEDFIFGEMLGVKVP